MKKVTIGTFASRGDAERAINHVHNELDVDKEDISYIYKNTEGDIKEVDSAKISSDKPRALLLSPDSFPVSVFSSLPDHCTLFWE